jgi:hypothetical protein
MATGTLVIRSNDIDRSKFTEANHRDLKAEFPHVDDDTIARYLIARDNDLFMANELLTKAEKWRSINYPILKQDCLGELGKGKFYTHGVDKEGRPLFIVHGIRHDPKNRNIEELAKATLWMVEQVIKRLPDNKSKYTVLMDRTDCGLTHVDLEFSKHFNKLFQDQHPERLHRAIVYPSGWIFWSIWSVVKWFLDPITREKVCPAVYLSDVQQYIDDEYIPTTMVSRKELYFSIFLC